MIKFLDLTCSICLFFILFPLFITLYVIGLFDTGSPLFIQERLGQKQKVFKLIKFRTMQIGTAQVGTHLASANDITKFGVFLRKTKLDELPQLINVIKGEMSLVGPRPGLKTQVSLRDERQKRSIFNCKPGVTGLAQINNIDMSTPRKLARYDKVMIKRLNILLYVKILLLTIIGNGSGDKIKT